jgi:hypothetical protein
VSSLEISDPFHKRLWTLAAVLTPNLKGRQQTQQACHNPAWTCLQDPSSLSRRSPAHTILVCVNLSASLPLLLNKSLLHSIVVAFLKIYRRLGVSLLMMGKERWLVL